MENSGGLQFGFCFQLWEEGIQLGLSLQIVEGVHLFSIRGPVVMGNRALYQRRKVGMLPGMIVVEEKYGREGSTAPRVQDDQSGDLGH